MLLTRWLFKINCIMFVLCTSVFSNDDGDINEEHEKQKYIGVDQAMYSAAFSIPRDHWVDASKDALLGVNEPDTLSETGDQRDDTAYNMDDVETVYGDKAVFEYPPLDRVSPGAIGEKVRVELETGVWYTRITRATQPPVFGTLVVF